MARLTIYHMDRRTLQRAMHAGRLHLDAEHCLSTEELILAGYLLDDAPQETLHGEPQDTPLLPLFERLTIAVEGLWQEVRQLRQALEQAPQAPPPRVWHTRDASPQGTP